MKDNQLLASLSKEYSHYLWTVDSNSGKSQALRRISDLGYQYFNISPDKKWLSMVKIMVSAGEAEGGIFMKKIKWIALALIVTIIAVFLTWDNLYSQQALAKRVPVQKGFIMTQQKEIVEVNFTFQPSWVPDKDMKDVKQIGQLIFQNYNSSIYLTSVSNKYDRNNEKGYIVANFEIKQNFNTRGGQYLSCYNINNQGFTPTQITVTGYDSNNNPLDKSFGSKAGTGPGETFRIYLRVKDLLRSPVKVMFKPLNLVQYAKSL